MTDVILKRYHDQDEWRKIDEKTARRLLCYSFLDVDRVLDDMRMGHSIATGFAVYRILPEGDPNDATTDR